MVAAGVPEKPKDLRFDMNSCDRVRHPSRSAGFMLSGVIVNSRFRRSPWNLYQIPGLVGYVSTSEITFKIFLATKHQLQRKDRKTKMSGCLAWLGDPRRGVGES